MPLNAKLEQRLSKLPKKSFMSTSGFRTASLFRDHPTLPVNKEWNFFYIGKESSDDEYIALKEVYMSIEDPTEYEFAIKVFGSFRHWKLISGLWWAKDHVAEWREELAVKLKSKAIKDVVSLVDSEFVKETTRLQGLKWLANSEYAEKPTETKKKASSKKEAIDKEVLRDVSDDFERLGIQPRSIN